MNSTWFSDTLYNIPSFQSAKLLENNGIHYKMLCYFDKDLNESSELMMSKLLNAININKEECLFLSFSNPEGHLAFKNLENHKSLQYCLFFGIHPKSMGLHIKIGKYLSYALSNKLFIFSDSIKKLNQDPQLKKRLWLALQKMVEA